MDKSRITIIYDLETSGFKCMPMFSYYHKVLQISAQCLETNEVFNSFVNPCFDGDIPPQSSNIHNITMKDVMNADTIDVVLRKMYKFFNFEKYTTVEMIAHNNKYFDELIIMKEYKNLGVDEVPSNVTFWDSLPWFRNNFPGLKSYNLGELYKHFFNKSFENAHRADADVEALVELYNSIIKPRRIIDHMTEEEVMFKLVYDECLVSIRYLGGYRANLCYYASNIETVSQLKLFAKTFLLNGDKMGFDTWLKEKIRVKNITHRMFIISHVYEIPIWFDEIFQFVSVDHTAEDCLNETDYYVKYKYVLNKKPPNKQVYNRGLIKMFNGDD